jgi:hypothetical protein
METLTVIAVISIDETEVNATEIVFQGSNEIWKLIIPTHNNNINEIKRVLEIKSSKRSDLMVSVEIAENIVQGLTENQWLSLIGDGTLLIQVEDEMFRLDLDSLTRENFKGGKITLPDAVKEISFLEVPLSEMEAEEYPRLFSLKKTTC